MHFKPPLKQPIISKNSASMSRVNVFLGLCFLRSPCLCMNKDYRIYLSSLNPQLKHIRLKSWPTEEMIIKPNLVCLLYITLQPFS